MLLRQVLAMQPRLPATVHVTTADGSGRVTQPAIEQPTHDAMAVGPYEFTLVAGEVSTELTRSCEKHPMYPRDPQRRIAIMVEEAGEALRESLDLTATQDCLDPKRSEPKSEIRARLRRELVHTAAMAIKALVAMSREDKAAGFQQESWREVKK